MSLILEVVGANAARFGEVARKEFNSSGTIGRFKDNDWVFPDEYISGHHALILLANDCFFIEDTSTNGLFINTRQNRLARGMQYLLCDGDTLYIDDYEIRVTLTERNAGVRLDEARFASARDSTRSGSDSDPLKLLGLRPPQAPARPSAAVDNAALPQPHRPAPAAPAAQGSKVSIPEAISLSAHPWRLWRQRKRGTQQTIQNRRAHQSHSGEPFGAPVASAEAPPTRRAVDNPKSENAPEPPGKSRVQMTVFGPSQVRRRQPFFLQTIFHPVGAESEALALARVVERQAAIAQVLPIPGKVRDGELITVRLRAESRVRVDELSQSLRWVGETVAAQFSIDLPWLDWRKEYLFTIEVDLSGCPVGRCKFRLSVGKPKDRAPVARAYGSLDRYQHAFLSYASQDRSVVADVAQLLEVQGIDYYLDQISQRVGSEWRREIEKRIESADLFLLCWSRHAAASQWVAREIRWALRAQRRTAARRPDIRPFVLDGPPIAPPPRALRHLHFNSATRLLKESGRATHET